MSLRMRILQLAVALVLGLGFQSAHAASAFFEGRGADLWVVGEDGQITGYNFDSWLESYLSNGNPLLPFSAGQSVLVNQLAGSSSPLTPNQPLVSVAGLGDADGTTGLPPSTLALAPAGGDFAETVAVDLLVSAETIRSETVRLSWQVGLETPQQLLISPSMLTAENIQNGYFVRTVYLVRDGSYDLTVNLARVDSTPLANAVGTYTLTTGPDGFRRDADGDGLPDLLEAALGLDPLNGDDWQTDLDGDGWSEFDEWLRQLCLDDSLNPTDTGNCLDAQGLPLDSDLDGWTDFDEQIRGTNPFDVEPILAPQGAETATSPAFLERVLAYKDYPSAQSLYEAERVLSGGLPPLSGAPGSTFWQSVAAASVSGRPAYDSAGLLSEEALDEATLDETEVAARLLRQTAEAQLALGQLPALRIPAGESLVVAATSIEIDTSAAVPQTTQRSLISKQWFSRIEDQTPAQFLDSGAADSWNTLDEWRAAFVTYLATNLVVTETAAIDLNSTIPVAVLEGALGEEARLTGGTPLQLFANTRRVIDPELVRQLEADLTDRFASLYSLDDFIATLPALLGAAGPLQPLDLWIRDRLASTPAGAVSDVYLAGAFQRSFSTDCFITAENLTDLQTDPTAFAAFTANCPDYFAEAELVARLDADAQRRFLARLFLLPGASAAVAADATLLLADTDSDSDELANDAELAAPLIVASLPWVADSDADLVLDGLDLCALDPFDACTGVPIPPLLTVDVDSAFAEPVAGEGSVLVGVQLDRAIDQEVVVEFQALGGLPGGATEGVDFAAVSGSVTIAPGELVAVIRIPVFADADAEGDELFELQITGVSNAVIGDDGAALITLNNTQTGVLPPNALLVADSIAVSTGELVTLDASLSSDPQEQTLSYLWSQTDSSGVIAPLGDPAQAVVSFVAPEVTQATTLSFQVSVANQSGLVDTASAQVVISPVNQPPQVVGSPQYSLFTNAPLEIPTAELLNAISDPEGDTLTLVSISSEPTAGRAELTANGVTYTPPADLQTLQLSSPALDQYVLLPFTGALSVEATGDLTGLQVDQANTDFRSGGLGSPVVQTFVPGASTLAGVDAFLAGTSALSSDVRLRVWAEPLRSGEPLVDVTLPDVPRSSELEFRFAPVAVVPGETYYLEFVTDLLMGAEVPGSYAAGAVIEGGGNLFNGGVDLIFATYSSTAVPGRLTLSTYNGIRVPLVDLQGETVETLVASPYEDLVYFVLRDGDARLYQFDQGDPRDVAVSGDFARSVVDPRSGDLYACAAGEWLRVSRDTLQEQATGVACEDSQLLQATVVGTSTCFAQQTTLSCTDETGQLSNIDSFPGGQIMGFAPVGYRGETGALMFVADADGTKYHTYVLKAFEPPNLRLVWSNGGRYLPAFVEAGVDTLVVVYSVNDQARPFIYSEPGGVPTFNALAASSVLSPANHVGELIRSEGQIYWYRQDFAASDQRVFYELNLDNSPLIELARFDIAFDSGVPFAVTNNFEDLKLYLQFPGSVPGACNLEEINWNGDFSRSLEIADLVCGTAVYQFPGIPYESNAAGVSARNLFIRYPQQFATAVNFSVRVRDSAGNETDLTVVVSLLFGGL